MPFQESVNTQKRSRKTAYFQGKNIIREDNDLVASVFVIFDEELASLELVRVHAIQQHPLPRLFTEVLAVEFRCHGTPYLCALIRGRQKVHYQISRIECT